MSLESSPTGYDDGDAPATFWQALINEKSAGDFLGLTARSMQKMRQTGGGPGYIHISSRCLRYRRVDLRTWAESRIRTSTSDPGRAAA